MHTLSVALDNQIWRTLNFHFRFEVKRNLLQTFSAAKFLRLNLPDTLFGIPLINFAKPGFIHNLCWIIQILQQEYVCNPALRFSYGGKYASLFSRTFSVLEYIRIGSGCSVSTVRTGDVPLRSKHKQTCHKHPPPKVLLFLVDLPAPTACLMQWVSG